MESCPHLPLPAVKLADRTDLSRGTRQRINRRRASLISASEAVLALNVASGSCKSLGLALSAATHLIQSRTQSAVLDDIFASVIMHEAAKGRESEEALRALLRADSVYEQASPGEFKSYASDCVTLPMCGKFDCT